jgi:hypothetical protein
VLDSIGQRLARAEASVKNLMIIAPEDKPGPREAIDSPAKAETALGANLVLAASLELTASQAKLFLRLLDAHSERVLRKGAVECAHGRDRRPCGESLASGRLFTATSQRRRPVERSPKN